jgi:hypothetical protein
MRKHGLKALVLAVMAALGLMAFSASSALAAELHVIMEPETSIPGFFLINNGTTSPTGTTKETIAGTGPGGRLIIPAKAAEIDCTAGSLTGSPFIENEYPNALTAATKKGGHGSGEATFTTCSVFSTSTAGVKGAELKACTEVLNGGTKTVTAKGLLRVVKHPETIEAKEVQKAFVVLEPQIASKANAEANIALTSSFTTLTFGGTCSLPAKVEIHGGVVVRAPVTDSNKPSLSVKSWEVSGSTAVLSAEQKLLGAQLTFGASPAFIEANSIVAELTGTNKAASWGAM